MGDKKRGFKQEPSRKDRSWWKRLWDWTEFGKKTGWQWIELLSALAIPVVLAIAGYWFTMQQDARQQQIEDQRAQDAALQAYLDQMSTLMIGQESLRDSGEGSEVRALARARTLTVLRRLGPAHKGSVVQFLHEAVLIQPAHQVGNDQPIGEPIIKLTGADLSEADLSYADLSGASLSTADLSRASGVTNAELEQAFSLEGATMPNGQKYEEWLKSKGRGEEGENSGPS